MSKLSEVQIDNVNTFDRALTDDERKLLYNPTIESLAAEVIKLRHEIQDLKSDFDRRIQSALDRQSRELQLRGVA